MSNNALIQVLTAGPIGGMKFYPNPAVADDEIHVSPRMYKKLVEAAETPVEPSSPPAAGGPPEG